MLLRILFLVFALLVPSWSIYGETCREDMEVEKQDVPSEISNLQILARETVEQLALTSQTQLIAKIASNVATTMDATMAHTRTFLDVEVGMLIREEHPNGIWTQEQLTRAVTTIAELWNRSCDPKQQINLEKIDSRREVKKWFSWWLPELQVVKQKRDRVLRFQKGGLRALAEFAEEFNNNFGAKKLFLVILSGRLQNHIPKFQRELLADTMRRMAWQKTDGLKARMDLATTARLFDVLERFVNKWNDHVSPNKKIDVQKLPSYEGTQTAIQMLNPHMEVRYRTFPDPPPLTAGQRKIVHDDLLPILRIAADDLVRERGGSSIGTVLNNLTKGMLVRVATPAEIQTLRHEITQEFALSRRDQKILMRDIEGSPEEYAIVFEKFYLPYFHILHVWNSHVRSERHIDFEAALSSDGFAAVFEAMYPSRLIPR